MVLGAAEAAGSPAAAAAVLWDSPVAVSGAAQLTEALREHARALGALVVDPAALDAPALEVLSAFARTPLGTALPLICASREAARVFQLRTLCRRFEEPSSMGPDFWVALRQSEERAIELELLFREFKETAKGLSDSGNSKAAKSCRVLSTDPALDPANAEAHAALGDLLASESEYEASLSANPCQPKPYLKLLELVPARARELRARPPPTARRTPTSCSPPRGPFGERASQAEAERLARRVLELHPGHAGAQELVAAATAAGGAKATGNGVTGAGGDEVTGAGGAKVK